MMPMVPMVLWTLQLWVSTLPPIHRSLYLSFSFDLAIFRFPCMILSHPIPLSPSISLYGKPIQYLCEIHEMQIQLNTYIERGYQRQFDNGFQIYAFLLLFNRWFSSLPVFEALRLRAAPWAQWPQWPRVEELVLLFRLVPWCTGSPKIPKCTNKSDEPWTHFYTFFMIWHWNVKLIELDQKVWLQYIPGSSG